MNWPLIVAVLLGWIALGLAVSVLWGSICKSMSGMRSDTRMCDHGHRAVGWTSIALLLGLAVMLALEHAA